MMRRYVLSPPCAQNSADDVFLRERSAHSSSCLVADRQCWLLPRSRAPHRYCKGVFTNDYKKTIGVDFLEKQLR